MKKIFLTVFAAGLLCAYSASGQVGDTTSTDNNLRQPVEAGDTIGTPDQSNRMHGQPGSFDNNSQDTTTTSGQGGSQGETQSQPPVSGESEDMDNAGEGTRNMNSSDTSGLNGSSTETMGTNQGSSSQGTSNMNRSDNDTTRTNSTGTSTGSTRNMNSTDTTGVQGSAAGSSDMSGNTSSDSSGNVNRGTGSSSMNQSGSGMDTTATGGSRSASNYGPEVEVVEGKEGPDNQVVYRINGEFFYVDRQEKQMVKIKEDELKDADDPAIIHRAGETGSAGKRKR